MLLPYTIVNVKKRPAKIPLRFDGAGAQKICAHTDSVSAGGVLATTPTDFFVLKISAAAAENK